MFHRPLLDVPDPFPSFCSFPPPSKQTLLPLTGIRKSPGATPHGGFQFGRLVEPTPLTNMAQHYRLGLFRGSDFAGTLKILNRVRVESCVSSRSRTFVPVSWMCNTQTSVSLNSTESEFISLDSGLRMDGIPRSSCLGFGETNQ